MPKEKPEKKELKFQTDEDEWGEEYVYDETEGTFVKKLSPGDDFIDREADDSRL